MKLCTRIVAAAVTAAALLGTVSRAQDVEPPFTWKGKGVVTFLAEQGVKDVSFNFELAVDSSGGIKGKTTSDEGESSIKHVFYGERVEHPIAGYYSRKAILVLAINPEGDNPVLAVLNGRLLAGKFFSGEALVKRLDPDSETDKALGVGNPVATLIEEDSLPFALKSALKKLMPIGTVKIEGSYQK